MPIGEPKVRLLLVEDDARLSEVLGEALRRNGWTVDAVGSCADTYAALRGAAYSAMVLDLGLPDGDGITLLRALRAVGDKLPILIMTARGRISERVDGLNAGADDYLVKPCAVPELQARLTALVRRASGSPDPILRLGPIEFDLSSRTATLNGWPLQLTSRPAVVLEMLMRANGRFVSRSTMDNALWGYDDIEGSRALDVYVTRLRKSFESAGANSVRIEAKRGFGYRLVV